MDETLNRPLFRHKAQIHYKRVQGLQIGGPPLDPFSLEGIQQSIRTRLSPGPAVAPAPQPRGLGALFMDVGPGKALKYGKKAYGLGMRGLEKVAGPIDRGYEKLATKYPKGIGTFLQGSGLAAGAGGVEDIIEGVRTDDPSKTAGGAANILFGKYLTKTGGSRYMTGKPTGETLVEGLVAPVGFGIGAAYLPKNELKRIQDAQIEQYETESGIKFNPKQRKEAETIIAQQYQTQQQGQQPKTALDVAFPGLSNVDIIEGKGRQDPVNLFSDVSRNIVQQSNDAKSIPPGGLSTEEIKSTLENDEKKRKQGENLKLKTSKKEEKGGSGFQKFYEEFDEQIGGSREISDLIMYKLATGLLTGTTTKSGFAGFADVLGKAGGDVLDTAILLASKEKDRKASLLEAYVKAQKANDGKSSVGTERYTIQVPDETAVFGKRNVTIARFKDGTDAKAIESNEIDPNTGKPLIDYVPLEFNPNAIELPKVSAKDLDERRAALNQVAGSYRMANTVAKADLGTVGAAGSIKLFKEKIIGSISDVLDNEITPAGYNKDSDLFVNTEILGKGVKKADGTFISAREAIAEKEKLINQIANKEKSIFGRPTPNELEKLIRNARYEVNFAYAYANSLKAEDRLTEKNLEDAKKVSAIFGLKSSKSIIEQFKQLADDADDKFKLEANRYLDIGGNNAYFEQNFEDIPSFKKEKNLRGGLQKRKEIQQNLMKGVETLPDKYK